MNIDLDDLWSEVVAGGPGFARVRVHGQVRSDAVRRFAAPALLIADATAWRRLATVPGTPPLVAGPTATAFSVDVEVPLHLLVAGGDWWLEPGAALHQGRYARAPDPAVSDVARRLHDVADEVAALRERLELSRGATAA